MRKMFGVLAAFTALGIADPAEAQMYGRLPLSLEVRGHAAFPTGDLGDERLGADLETGYGAGVDLTFHLTPLFGIYGGGSWTQFKVDDLGDANFTDYGFDLGAKLMLPTGTSFAPFLRGGAVFHQVKSELGNQEFDYEDEKVGFEIGGGFALPLGTTVSFTPSVRYVNFGLGTGDVDFSYVAAGLGLLFRF